MKRTNYKKAMFSLCAACALIFAASAQITAQKKTSSTSPCVDITAGKGKDDVNQTWANLDYEPCKEAVSSLRAASLIVLGEKLEVNIHYADFRLQQWLMEMGQQPVWKAKFDGGFEFTDAVAYLKETDLSKRNDIQLNAFFNGIFRDVYGRDVNSSEAAVYAALVKARKEWYATIFFKEKNKLNQNPQLRETMIDNSYKQAFGRAAKPDETAYWKPRTEICREIIEADRAFLYAPNNAAVLREVVVRRLTSKTNGRPPAAETVAQKIKDFTTERRVYSEMY